MNEKIELTLNLVNELLNYLDERPHKEVRKFIDSIHKEAMEYQQSKNSQVKDQGLIEKKLPQN